MNSDLEEEMAMSGIASFDNSEIFKKYRRFNQVMCWYGCAIREVRQS